eukprot:2141902-Pyramimonas_sp.AAC.1
MGGFAPGVRSAQGADGSVALFREHCGFWCGFCQRDPARRDIVGGEIRGVSLLDRVCAAPACGRRQCVGCVGGAAGAP